MFGHGMRYQYIAYVSAAVKPLSAEEVDALLLDARAFNLKAGVTGVLLCHKTTFFQFFEGPPRKCRESLSAYFKCQATYPYYGAYQ